MPADLQLDEKLVSFALISVNVIVNHADTVDFRQAVKGILGFDSKAQTQHAGSVHHRRQSPLFQIEFVFMFAGFFDHKPFEQPQRGSVDKGVFSQKAYKKPAFAYGF